MNQFSRLELLIGKESLSKLKEKTVAIFGLGGVGGNVADALARSGITKFILVDNDKVSITNINRQLIANTNSIGKYKVDVMEEHLKSINPNIMIVKKQCFYLPDNNDQFDFGEYDYVVDAIDTVTAKIDIISKCNQLNVPIISALGCGNRLDPTKLVVSDIFKTEGDPLAKVIRHELRKRNISKLKVVYSKEKPIPHKEEIDEELPKGKKDIPGSSAFVPPVAGIIIASEVIKDLIK